MIETLLLGSLYRVFPENCPQRPLKEISGLRNETLSFQMAYKMKEAGKVTPFHVLIESELPISIYAAEYVPVKHTGAAGFDNPPKPGLYPDIMLPKATNPELTFLNVPGSSKRFTEKGETTILNASGDSWQSLWFTVNEQKETLKAGSYPITLRLFESIHREFVREERITIQIMEGILPQQRLIYTNWLHCDCICDLHHVKLFSEEFWAVLESYLKVAATYGMNMVLMPAFTPPLDTPIGTERMTVQLVDIEVQDGHYSFDFTKMKQFTDLCRKTGIRYLEHSHLFSQWGATAAPKIVDRNQNLLFGWDTDATGDEYKNFLQEYLKALISFLKQEDLEDAIFFHISDEPKDFMMEAYQKATAHIRKILEPYNSGDALSHYCFYEDGTVKTPIVRTKAAEDFNGRCDNMWGYYTGNDMENGLSNRVLTIQPERNRMLGVQLYQYGMKGFLHWGLNYYYDVLSHGIFDPRFNPCGYRNHAGTSFFVYPSYSGTALPSMRQMVFYEGIQDYEALCLLEEKKGRQLCDQLIQKHFGKLTFHTCPETPEQLTDFRKELNQLIAE